MGLFNFKVHKRIGCTVWDTGEVPPQPSGDRVEITETIKKTHKAGTAEAIGHRSDPIYLERL